MKTRSQSFLWIRRASQLPHILMHTDHLPDMMNISCNYISFCIFLKRVAETVDDEEVNNTEEALTSTQQVVMFCFLEPLLTCSSRTNLHIRKWHIYLSMCHSLNNILMW